MELSGSFEESSVIRWKIGALLCVVLLCATRPVFSGSIVGWGGGWEQAAPFVGNDFIAVASSNDPLDDNLLALKSDGSVVGWGGDCQQAASLVGNDFVAVAAGGASTRGTHSLALRADGSIIGWGTNDYGQATPPNGNDFVAIAAGGPHSLALRADGTIVGWGRDGEVTPPSGNDFVAIAAGGGHSLALRADGSIVGWGGNRYGEATTPAGNDFVAIAAGVSNSLALRSDGSIVGWGQNRYGEATPPAGNDFVAITAGSRHSLALRSDGSIVGWGENRHGEATPPAGNDFVAIAAGYGYSLAIRESGPKGVRLIRPNGGESLVAGSIHTTEWQSTGSINQVSIEYFCNTDSNYTLRSQVCPASSGNTRRYNWMVPNITSDRCLLRIFASSDPYVGDLSDDFFTIYECTLKHDYTGDCFVDMKDFTSFALEWLQCGNPFDPNCLPQ